MTDSFPAPLAARLERAGVVAVLVLEKVEHAVPVAEALLRGGVDVMELTLRTPAAVDCLRAIRSGAPEMLAGIGTVLTTDQVDEVLAADAAFGVSPGLNPHVVEHAQRAGLPFAPGIMSPSDIEAAVALGCRTLKFFPAETAGGLAHLASMKAPYRHLGLRYVPLGGVNEGNTADYLADADVLAVGGSWLAKADVIAAQDWDRIEATAARASQIVVAARGAA